MLFGFLELLDIFLLLIENAMARMIFFNIELLLVIVSNIWVFQSPSFAVDMGVKKLKKVPAQYIRRAETIQNS
jgi:hypothetical protein